MHLLIHVCFLQLEMLKTLSEMFQVDPPSKIRSSYSACRSVFFLLSLLSLWRILLRWNFEEEREREGELIFDILYCFENYRLSASKLDIATSQSPIYYFFISRDHILSLDYDIPLFRSDNNFSEINKLIIPVYVYPWFERLR